MRLFLPFTDLPQRCLKDLRERFAKIRIQVSPPIVPFRETAVSAPDMAPPKALDGAPRGTVTTTLAGGAVTLTVRARPLPSDVTAFLIAHSATIKRIHASTRTAADDLDAGIERAATSALTGADAVLSADEFWTQLERLFEQAGEGWTDAASKIWSFGPKRLGSNVLIDAGTTRSCAFTASNCLT